MKNKYSSSGDVSEWNEGNFKTLRLHQAQVLINESKLNPFNQVFGMWGFMAWFRGGIILFGEGMDKYSSSEMEEVVALKKYIEDFLEEKFVCSTIKDAGKPVGVNINKENWKKLREKLELFEYKIKSFNNKHGLSTRNVGTKGMF